MTGTPTPHQQQTPPSQNTGRQPVDELRAAGAIEGVLYMLRHPEVMLTSVVYDRPKHRAVAAQFVDRFAEIAANVPAERRGPEVFRIAEDAGTAYRVAYAEIHCSAREQGLFS